MKEAWSRSRPLVLVALALFLGVLPRQSSAQSAEATIQRAYWHARTSLLTVKGANFGAAEQVTLRDTATGRVLGRTTAQNGAWQLAIPHPAIVPCSVLAESSTTLATRAVSGAPATCSSHSIPTAVFGFNDLGMHCFDADFSVFAILPPFNVVHAQVVRKGATPLILGSRRATLTYAARADSSGSRNTTSSGKTNFWEFAPTLFGASLPADRGLLGAIMPGAGNARPFQAFDAAHRWFTAPGIPITDTDNKGLFNPYPLMRFRATDKAAPRLSQAFTDIVLPVSSEMHCSQCHATGADAADAATQARYPNLIAAWSTNANPELQYRENVLILHDAKHTTPLMATKPVLCASCHYSPALDLKGAGPAGDQVGKPLFSFAVHGGHGKTLDKALPDNAHPAVIPEAGITTCYSCHPGQATKCLRGVMSASGLICQDCHGGMLAVGGQFPPPGSLRKPWLNEPRCESCHTGDAVDHKPEGIRLRIAYSTADPSATPITSRNKRFAEEPGKLYRNSLGHGGMACEACHGSTHAEWPNADPKANDNVAAIQLQGHPGPIIECSACHGTGLKLNMFGPHGLHNINDRAWTRSHFPYFFQSRGGNCSPCHGTTGQGTVLTRAAADRRFGDLLGAPITIRKGEMVHCGLCHGNPF